MLGSVPSPLLARWQGDPIAPGRMSPTGPAASCRSRAPGHNSFFREMARSFWRGRKPHPVPQSVWTLRNWSDDKRATKSSFQMKTRLVLVGLIAPFVLYFVFLIK